MDRFSRVFQFKFGFFFLQTHMCWGIWVQVLFYLIFELADPCSLLHKLFTSRSFFSFSFQVACPCTDDAYACIIKVFESFGFYVWCTPIYVFWCIWVCIDEYEFWSLFRSGFLTCTPTHFCCYLHMLFEILFHFIFSLILVSKLDVVFWCLHNPMCQYLWNR